jgi:micrococcal nuclease
MLRKWMLPLSMLLIITGCSQGLNNAPQDISSTKNLKEYATDTVRDKATELIKHAAEEKVNGIADKVSAAASLVSTTKPGDQSVQTDAKGRFQAKVVRVIDGDTVKILLNGSEETIRFLLVDTPETHHPKKPVEPFGPEAAKFTTNLLTGKTVELESDIGSMRDKYGRLLLYVFLDGKSVQEMLLERGLARVAYIHTQIKYLDEFRKVQKHAQQKGLGIWSIENYAREDGYHPEIVK